MAKKHLGVLAAGFVALLVNPGFGCSDAFSFGPEEMRRAVEGTWEMTVPGETGVRARFTLAYAEAGAQARGVTVVQQATCTTRSFIADAGACTAASSMVFRGRVLSGADAYRDQAVSARFLVVGLEYGGGAVSVTFGHGPRLEIRVDEKNVVVDAFLNEPMTRTAVVAVRVEQKA